MQAIINKGLDSEIQWSIDDAITPELVHHITSAGDRTNINWLESPFAELIDLLLFKYDYNEIEEKLFDEDPEIIELGVLSIDNPILPIEDQEKRKMIRLYFPVMLVILDKMQIENN